MKSFLIVPLGNPGSKYEYTRHNAGRVVIESIAKEVMKLRDVTILLPSSFMNESGKDVSRFLAYNKKMEAVIVYDDKDLPIGVVRISFGRSAGGHNGVRSIEEHLKTKDFIRIRIGIAPKKDGGEVVVIAGERTANYVLGVLSKGDADILRTNVADKVLQSIMLITSSGLARAQEVINSQ